MVAVAMQVLTGPQSKTHRIRLSLRTRRLIVLALTLAGLVAATLGATTLGSGSASAAPPYGSGHGLCFDINSPLRSRCGAVCCAKKVLPTTVGFRWRPTMMVV